MIVEFLEGREFMCGWVLTAQSRRHTVLALNGREMSISPNRILNSACLPDPETKPGRLELLKGADAARRELAATVDLRELWEVLEGEGPLFDYAALASLYYGRASGPDEASALARAVFADGLLFRFSPEGALRHSAEEVEAIAAKKRRIAEAERELAEISFWLSASLKGAAAEEPAGAPAARQALMDLALWGDKAERRGEALKILNALELPLDETGAFKVLVALGDFSRHENLELRRLQLPLLFEPCAAAAVEELVQAAGARTVRDDRLDLTALPTLTIDSSGARDLDDAISIKSLAGGRFQVGIHIADAAAFIRPDSVLDNEARLRASSLYLPEGKYPMLPSELSEGVLSLTLGDVKPAFSFLATLEKDGRVSDYSMQPSLIRVDRQFSFAEADQRLDDDSELVDLWDLAQALLNRRQAAGGINLNIPKLNVYFSPDGALNLGLTQWDTPAKVIVGELMILANYLAADLLHKRGYPCPYRYQDKARALAEGENEPAEGAAEADLALAVSLAARRRTGRSGLSFVPAPHHGLGLPLYTAFTAPMRRYMDLLVARQLRSLATGGPAMSEQQFIRLALPAYELQQRIQKMQGLRQRYWLFQHLAEKLGREFSALVFEQRDRRLRVCLTDFMLETEFFLPRSEAGRSRLFGRRLKLKLLSVPSAGGGEGPKFELVK